MDYFAPFWQKKDFSLGFFVRIFKYIWLKYIRLASGNALLSKKGDDLWRILDLKFADDEAKYVAKIAIFFKTLYLKGKEVQPHTILSSDDNSHSVYFFRSFLTV